MNPKELYQSADRYEKMFCLVVDVNKEYAEELWQAALVMRNTAHDLGQLPHLMEAEQLAEELAQERDHKEQMRDERP